MRNFRDLKVWEKGHRMTLAVYKATATFPHHELYGLTSQMRRSSVSANIAEDCGRGSDADLARFLQMAAGSASGSEYHVLLANELRSMKDREYEGLAREVTEVKRMLTSLIQKLKADR